MPWTPVVEVGTGSSDRTVEVVATDDSSCLGQRIAALMESVTRRYSGRGGWASMSSGKRLACDRRGGTRPGQDGEIPRPVQVVIAPAREKGWSGLSSAPCAGEAATRIEAPPTALAIYSLVAAPRDELPPPGEVEGRCEDAKPAQPSVSLAGRGVVPHLSVPPWGSAPHRLPRAVPWPWLEHPAAAGSRIPPGLRRRLRGGVRP